MTALTCLLDKIKREIREVDRGLRHLRCLAEVNARCLCSVYLHPFCTCRVHPFPFCLCGTRRYSHLCCLCDLYPYCLCDRHHYCPFRPSLRSLERRTCRFLQEEKRELAKLRRQTNRMLVGDLDRSSVLASVDMCEFEPDQVKVKVKDGKVSVSAERENTYECLGSKNYSYMNICKEFNLPPGVDEKDVIYSFGTDNVVKIETLCELPGYYERKMIL
ncbi:outer dense fiber protein 1 [Ornithorhynchus anatinus]|uniref:Outer dense fiber protein 1 n=1 Tax=Ornithorhynchus anatinus TaxID=9258 RepID=A0A6I8NPY8_ORNAN|nr:outer dense fiber protein 1 [Ornithorhynchus anatinus]